MVERIYLEAHEVGASGFGHLYLVKKDDLDLNNINNGAEVIRGGIGFPFQLSIETGLLSDSQDSYADTGSHISIDITDLVGGVGNWSTLEQAAMGLIGLHAYIVSNPSEGGFTTNSNATILCRYMGFLYCPSDNRQFPNL